MTDKNSTYAFESLTPDFIMQAVESQTIEMGWYCDARLLALNSYENRVYQVGIEDQLPLIAKFYRPDRWTKAQILEDHDFSYELAEHELPVVTPIKNKQGNSLFEYENFYFSLFPRRGGHAPEFDNLDNLLTIGRLVGRMHAIGARKPFQHRPSITAQNYGHESIDFITQHFIPAALKDAYTSVTSFLMEHIDAVMTQYPATYIRTHSDCHVGNMLWRDDSLHFVDFDDVRMAPAIQDLWMLLSGDRHRQSQQIQEILEGYEEFYTFNPIELQLIEVLRTLRLLHYSAWLARRWKEAAFQRSFPWFNTPRYWDDQILALREQQSALQEPALSLSGNF